ncbi:hypothetical protein [Pseudomonas canadensis]|uniref:hypothetical protein n=1 Tax=Pseudomonas canadensis TaxID=915099 RepID=UPI003BA204F1
MTLMIDASQLKHSVQAADEAWQEVLRQDERLMELQALLRAIPTDPDDKLACDVQLEVIKRAKSTYNFLQGVVVVELRSAILNAELRVPDYCQ